MILASYGICMNSFWEIEDDICWIILIETC